MQPEKDVPIALAKPGDRVFCRDSWGIITSVIVDFVDGLLLVGKNNRNAQVRGPIGYFWRTFEKCEDRFLCLS